MDGSLRFQESLMNASSESVGLEGKMNRTWKPFVFRFQAKKINATYLQLSTTNKKTPGETNKTKKNWTFFQGPYTPYCLEKKPTTTRRKEKNKFFSKAKNQPSKNFRFLAPLEWFLNNHPLQQPSWWSRASVGITGWWPTWPPTGGSKGHGLNHLDFIHKKIGNWKYYALPHV